MKYNRYIIAVIAALAAFMQASAQNLDPTVEVNRAYEGKLMEVHKPVLKMEVPDSVMQFDLEFDYSVFESPYRGSYEFNPYLLSMKPGSAPDGSRRFYMRAGAGYQLHPVFDLVWSPETGKGFKIDVYAVHRSFIGSYWNISPVKGTDDIISLDRIPKGASDRTWKGYGLKTKAGFDARHDWKKGVFSFGAGYYGIAQDDRRMADRNWKRTFNALDAYLGLGNKGEWEQSFLYDLRLSYRIGGDRTKALTDRALNEQLFGFEASLGPVFKENHKVLFDVGADVALYAHERTASGGQITFTPHYVFERGPFMLDFGVHLAKLLHTSADTTLFHSKGQVVYPSMKFHVALVPDAMRFYVHAGGGTRMNTYSSLLERNPHLSLTAPEGAAPILDYTVERVSLSGGFEGRISSRFSYNLKAGYVNYANDILEAVMIDGSDRISSGISYGPYQKWYAGADVSLDVEGFRIDCSVVYSRPWGQVFDMSGVFRPASLKGEAAVEYNWRKRIFVGADCSFASAREGSCLKYSTSSMTTPMVAAVIPGYADLGLYAEYVTSRRLSFWLRGGNLLNQTVQRCPLYAEKGVDFTVGICLNL
ncbi:MAG: hypothetical protein IJ394_02675 [Bacteroidales bacterium]|nr:hypothetical protein [Bacteroidales bacterium]